MYTPKVGEKIETSKLGCREFNPNETLQTLRAYGGTDFWCWGADNFVQDKNIFLRFEVTGLKHKGFVFITLSGMDLYDAVLTNRDGIITEVVTDMYFDDLFSRLDHYIERDRR
tara:strand:+ start:4949 stop:5287 length:339 start_codon:yes stop_codon:yes gene_type:complete